MVDDAFVAAAVYDCSLHYALSCAVYCNRPCLCVCLFVGPPYYSQRAVFVSPLSSFFIVYFQCNFV